ATVMPHNLYLHSAIVHTRDIEQTSEGKRQAINFNTWDTLIALGLAFFVNAAILVLAGAVFYTTGHRNVEDLGVAHRLLAPLLGTTLASTAFAIALLASGQSSTITGTLAGQIVMEGFLHIRIKPWLRRIISRVLAIIPAVVMIYFSGGHDTVGLLVISQVVLSMQLPFAIFPLLMFTSNPDYMGEFVNPLWLKIVGYSICVVIAVLNVYLLVTTINYLWVIGFTVVGGLFSIWVMYFYHEKDENKNAIKSQSAS
ncbi:MAG: divalent metal cation transporter, partial [Abditibacteriaceae bacterium]